MINCDRTRLLIASQLHHTTTPATPQAKPIKRDRQLSVLFSSLHVNVKVLSLFFAHLTPIYLYSTHTTTPYAANVSHNSHYILYTDTDHSLVC